MFEEEIKTDVDEGRTTLAILLKHSAGLLGENFADLDFSESAS